MAKRGPVPNPVSPPSIDAATALDLLEGQIQKANALLEKPPLDTATYCAWENTTRDYLIKAFGSASGNIDAVMHAHSDHLLIMGGGDAQVHRYQLSRLANQVKMIKSCLEQLQTEMALSAHQAPEVAKTKRPRSEKVFVVHGHDDGLRETVARFLESLGVKPVILHEQPNLGRTLIEKFSDYADVDFAVVLLTPDDVGQGRDEPPPPRPRARQNVILELGYFLGKIGQARVCAIYQSDVEIPSDFQGVLFVPVDARGSWRLELGRELKAAGFDINGNKILSKD